MPKEKKISAYHATNPERMAQIRHEGLAALPQPPDHAGEERCTDEAVLFFAIDAEHAALWGPVILRFPWPDEAYEDSFGDSILREDEVLYTNWYTPEAVPAYCLEVFENGSWHALSPDIEL